MTATTSLSNIMQTTETATDIGAPIYFDLETRPHQERTRDWIPPYPPFTQPPPFDPENLIEKHPWSQPGAVCDPKKLPMIPPSAVAKLLGVKVGNLKDELKIWAKVLDQAKEDIEVQANALDKWEQGGEAHEAAFFNKAALSPRTAEVFMLQYAKADEEIVILEGEETDILREFFNLVHDQANQFFVNWTGGSNKSNWDLNMLYRRGIDLDLLLPNDIRPMSWGGTTSRFMDLTPRLLGHGDWNSFCSLEDAAKELHIPVTPGPVTGENCWRYYGGVATAADGCLELEPARQRELSIEYGKQDVRLLRRIYQRLCDI